MWGAVPSLADNRYLGPQGSDAATGTLNAPWKTLGKAHGLMAAGDTLFIRGGTYTGVTMDWSNSGSAGKPMVIKAYPGDTPVFQGNGSDTFMRSTGQYLIFDGLEISGYTRCAFNPTGGGHLTFRNCDMHDILAQEYGAVTPQYCDNVVIENNTFRKMGRSLTQTMFDHAIYNAAGSHDIVIRSNLFLDSHGGPAINHYHTPSPYNVLIYDNVFVMTLGSERSGVFTGDGAHDVRVFNNTFYIDANGAETAYGVKFNSGNGTNEAVNNIFYWLGGDANSSIMAPGKFQDLTDGNLYFPSKDPDDTGAHSYVGDPLFVDAKAGDFHLSPGSPAINSGRTLNAVPRDLDGISRPIGSGFDIGAYEYPIATGLSGSAMGSRSRSISERNRAVGEGHGHRYLFYPLQTTTPHSGDSRTGAFDAQGNRTR